MWEMPWFNTKSSKNPQYKKKSRIIYVHNKRLFLHYARIVYVIKYLQFYLVVRGSIKKIFQIIRVS